MMEARKLLYATNIRQPSFSEFERLLILRMLGLEEVIFLHSTKVEGWESKIADFGMNSKTLMAEGPLVPRILNVAHQEAASLIAATLNRDTRRLLRGSLITQLLRASTLPVLVLPEHVEAAESEKKGMFDHVIFATDWSAASERAFDYLLNFNTIIKELEIVHVIHKKPSVRDMRNLREKLSQARTIFLDHGIDAEAHVYAGKPSEEIMLSAKDYGATCIAMGTTGMWTLKDMLLHSCSYRVAEASLAPILVIP